MTYFPAFRQKYDGLAAGQVDAFSRQRVSEPVTIFDYQSEYDIGAKLWENVLTGSGTAAHNFNDCCVDLAVTTASGDKVTRQTRQYHRYQPGKSQLIMATFVAAAQQANMDQRVGYFDDDNGIFLELSGASTKQIVRRTNTSGSPVDTDVTQANWNLDKLDGTGISGVTLDFTKSQILIIDLEWLGVGSVRVGFVVDGAIIYAHQFNNANSLSSVYMRTANLPVRYEIETTGVAGSAATLKAVCTSVISEGGFESNRGYPFSVSNGATTISVTTRRPILSIRPKALFNSIVNRGDIIPNYAGGFAETNAAHVEVVYGGSLTGASFSSVNADSITEYDVTATAISGGITVAEFDIPASGSGINATGANILGLLSRLPLTLDSAGANPINLSLVATSHNATAAVSGNLGWQELR